MGSLGDRVAGFVGESSHSGWLVCLFGGFGRGVAGCVSQSSHHGLHGFLTSVALSAARRGGAASPCSKSQSVAADFFFAPRGVALDSLSTPWWQSADTAPQSMTVSRFRMMKPFGAHARAYAIRSIPSGAAGGWGGLSYCVCRGMRKPSDRA